MSGCGVGNRLIAATEPMSEIVPDTFFAVEKHVTTHRSYLRTIRIPHLASEPVDGHAQSATNHETDRGARNAAAKPGSEKTF